MPSFAEVKVLQQQNMLIVHHMHTWVCTVFKWNYEQHLYTHTLIPIINRFASTNEPLSTQLSHNKYKAKKKNMCVYCHMLKKIRVGRSEINFFFSLFFFITEFMLDDI